MLSLPSLKTAVMSAALAALTVGGVYACSRAEAASTNASAVPTRAIPGIKGVEKAVPAIAPNVPPPISRDHATKVIVELETVEKTMRLADGIDYTFWTFGGHVPGNFIRVREGDLLEFTLKNHPHATVPHNIDLHAVTGPGGGAAATLTLRAAIRSSAFARSIPGSTSITVPCRLCRCTSPTACTG